MIILKGKFGCIARAIYALVIFGGCLNSSLASENTCFASEETDSDRRGEQLKYVANLFFPKAYLESIQQEQFIQAIMQLNSDSRDRAQLKYRNSAQHEQQYLDKLFPGEENLDLKLLALSDRDSDGIPDFRINGNGEFIENDIDLDNDGIFNAIDLKPFDQNLNADLKDTDSDGIADHLDWSNTDLYSKSDLDQSRQFDLFDRFGITLVESRLDFDSTAVKIVNDTFTKVLASKQEFFKTSEALGFVVSTCSDSMYNNWGTSGEVPAGTQKMYLYEPLLADTRANKHQLAALLVSVHEAIHTVQYALDKTDSVNMLRYNVHRNSDNFVNEMNRLGWKLSTSKLKDEKPQYAKSYVDNESEETLFAEVKVVDGDEITLSDIRDVHYANDSLGAAVTYNVVHSYSLDNVWEWHAENLTVSVLSRIYKQLPALVGENRTKFVIACVNKSLREGPFASETYMLETFSPSVAQELQETYPISNQFLEYLAKEYIVNAFAGECT